MLYLDTTLMTLQAVLAGAITTSQPEVHVYFYDNPASKKPTFEEQKGILQRNALNSTTDVTICSAPAQPNVTRNIVGVTVYNKDTVNVTVTVKTDNGTTEDIMVKKTLATGETLFYEHGSGWGII